MPKAKAAEDTELEGVPRELLPAFASLSPEKQQKFKRVWEFRALLRTESDRGAALMTASFLDDLLADLLRARLLLNSQLKAKLFDYSGPLGTFSARINMAYAFGLLAPPLSR